MVIYFAGHIADGWDLEQDIVTAVCSACAIELIKIKLSRKPLFFFNLQQKLHSSDSIKQVEKFNSTKISLKI